MNINLTPFFGIDVLLLAVVAALFAWRQAVARKEDDSLHLQHGTIAEQTTVATKLEKIDKWGKLTTVIAVVLGLIVGGVYLYQFWVNSNSVPGM
ncbi:MAG TPA: hypothetical protein VE959_18155 [Bryobacteraceae bacterium]|nr:hypothetical protein [Bryobacteraceae bacterium]